MMLLNSVPNTVASCKVNRKIGILILMFHVKLCCTCRWRFFPNLSDTLGVMLVHSSLGKFLPSNVIVSGDWDAGGASLFADDDVDILN